MFIDKSNLNIDELTKFEKELKDRCISEIYGFLNLEQLWDSIQNCIKHKVFNVFFAFNGKYIILEDDNISEDEVYKFICGKTKEQKKIEDDNWLAEYQRKEKQWKDKIPFLTKEYEEKGRRIIAEKYWLKWEELVPIRLNDIYHGFDLDAVLQLIEIANNNESLQNIYKKMFEQGHSGFTYFTVLGMFKELSDVGKQFYDFVSKKEKV